MLFVGKLDARTSALVFQRIRVSGEKASLATVRKGGIGFDMELCGSGNAVLTDFDGLFLVSTKRKQSVKAEEKIGDFDNANIPPSKH